MHSDWTLQYASDEMDLAWFSLSAKYHFKLVNMPNGDWQGPGYIIEFK